MSTANYNYYYLTPGEFFIPPLVDGLALDFVSQQISLGLQDSSEYSGRSQHCCSLDVFDSSFAFQPFQFSFQGFGELFQAHQL